LAAYNHEFYTDVQNLSYLQYHLERDPRSAKYRLISEQQTIQTPSFAASARSTPLHDASIES
jgi:GPN-loop GTPase